MHRWFKRSRAVAPWSPPVLCYAGRSDAAVVGVAAAIVEHRLAHQAWSIQRAVRNAEDVVMVARLPGPELPPMGTWAIEGDFARLIPQELDREPNVVVELGSGVSTFLIASILSRRGFGRLLSIDHDGSFAAATGARLARAEVVDRVELAVVPMRRQTFGASAVAWYDATTLLGALPPDPIDLLIVDGPPSTADWARWPAIKVLLPQLSPSAVVLLDDGRQRRERAAAMRWVREHPELELYWLDTLKGTWRLERRRSRPESAAVRFVQHAWRCMNHAPCRLRTLAGASLISPATPHSNASELMELVGVNPDRPGKALARGPVFSCPDPPPLDVNQLGARVC